MESSGVNTSANELSEDLAMSQVSVSRFSCSYEKPPERQQSRALTSHWTGTITRLGADSLNHVGLG